MYLGDGTNTAQEVTLTGDVTIDNAGVSTIGVDKIITTKIKNNNVTYAKIQSVTSGKVLGRVSSGTGIVEEIGTTGTGDVVRANSPVLTGTVTANAISATTLIATTLNATSILGTILKPSQPIITTVGTLTALNVSGASTLTGNTSIGGTLGVTGVTTLSAQPILSTLTASLPVFSDGNKGLVSNPITGTGSVVMSVSPILTGTPLAPTATAGTNNTQIATTAYVTNEVTAINTLADGTVYLGDSNGDAQEVTLSGDVTISNTGVSTIGASKVTTAKILDANVTTAKIADANVTTAKILDANVTTAKIADANVTTAKILDANVTNAKLDKTNIPLSGFGAAGADVALGANKLTGVADPTLAQDAATKAYVDVATVAINTLANGKVYLGDSNGDAQEVTLSGDVTISNTGVSTIGASKVTTAKILDANVTTAKIADANVTTAKILDANVTTAKIADANVTTAKILDANVTNAKLDKTNIPLSGFGAAGADVALGANKLTGVADPTLAQDAATKNYVDVATVAINTLADGKVYLGDVSNVAQEVTLSGDVTIDNAGATTIGSSKVVSSMINDGTIVAADIANDAVITSKILDANVTTAKIADANITTAKLLDANVTNAKLDKTNIPLSGFAATTSTELAGVISDETGTGNVVLSASPALTGTPLAPTAASGTNTTQLATTAFVTAANTTNANLTGPITSSGNVTAIASKTGTGTKFVMDTSPTIGGTTTLSSAIINSTLNVAGTTALQSTLAVAGATTLSSTLNVAGVATFTGTPLAPTAASGTNTTQLATTAFVTAANTTNANLTGMVTSSGNATTVVTNADLTGEVTSTGNAATLTNSAVIGKVLTGYTAAAGTIAATDNILEAIQKLDGNNTTNANLTGPITSVGNATSVASQTGTGTKFVMDTSPTLVTPVLGVATATSINGSPIPSSKTFVVTTDKLDALSATTSSELAGVISDETGTGSVVLSASPSLTGVPTAPTAAAATNTTQLATTAFVGDAVSTAVGASVADAINDGTTTIAPSQNAVFDALALKAPLASPTLVTPILGAATATTVNKLTLTAPATAATLTLANGSTLATAGAFSQTLTATGTTAVTLPTTGTLATLAGTETLTNKTLTSPTITGTGAIAGTFTGDLTGNITGAVTGNADTATKIASITNSNIVQLAAIQTLTNKSLTSPTLTGTPTLPTGTIGVTQTAGNSSTAIATTAFVGDAVSTAVGASVADAINDGTTTIAPSQNAVFDALALKAPLASPTFTGTPTLPTGSIGVTQTTGDSSTALATTAFVTAANTTNATNISSNDTDIATNATNIAALPTSLNGLTDGLVESNSLYIGNNPSSTSDNASYNVAVGTTALDAITTGDNNSALGYDALTANTSGYENTASGVESLYNNTSGRSNTAMGYRSLRANTTGGYNTASGVESMYSNTTGQFNSAFGLKSLRKNTTASYNTALGYAAGYDITTGEKNTIIGYQADVSSSSTNQIVIGYQADGQGDNYAVIGNSDITRLYAAEDAGATVYAAGLNLGGIAVTSTAAELNYVDGVTSNIQTQLDAIGSSSVREVADEFSATSSQTSFTLTQTPSSNSKVKMYINGIRISNTAYSVSGTTLTYIAANNGSYALTASDRVQFDFYY